VAEWNHSLLTGNRGGEHHGQCMIVCTKGKSVSVLVDNIPSIVASCTTKKQYIITTRRTINISRNNLKHSI
jgi:cellobiose-specific phosphotransferase system component IIB